MAKIINPGFRAIVLPTLHVVPRLGELITTNEVIQHTDNWPRLKAMFDLGEIGIELDPAPEIVSPIYATDYIAPEPLPTGKQPVYPTDPVAAPVETANTPAYPTDPVPVEPAEPLPIPAPIAPEVAPDEPAEAVTGPVDLPADAILAKAKK